MLSCIFPLIFCVWLIKTLLWKWNFQYFSTKKNVQLVKRLFTWKLTILTGQKYASIIKKLSMRFYPKERQHLFRNHCNKCCPIRGKFIFSKKANKPGGNWTTKIQWNILDSIWIESYSGKTVRKKLNDTFEGKEIHLWKNWLANWPPPKPKIKEKNELET